MSQGLGLHCFGDYSAIHYSNIFQIPKGAEAVYPLVTRVFRFPFLLIETISSYRVGLASYLIALALAILFPVLHTYFKRQIMLSLPCWLSVTFLNIGMISSLDRGNMIAFAVPFMYLFLIKFQEGNSKNASVYLTLATMVKPQLALFAIVFLWRREIKTFLVFTVRTALSITAPYLVFGTKSMTFFTAWIDETINWSKSLAPTAEFPTNYSFNRILGILDINYPTFSFILGFVLLAGLSFPIIVKKKRILLVDLISLSFVVICMNSIVYIYYSVLLIPVWLLLFSKSDKIAETDHKRTRGSQFAEVLLALATAPLAWPSQWRIGNGTNESGAYNTIPILVTLGVVVLVGLTIGSNVRVMFNRRYEI